MERPDLLRGHIGALKRRHGQHDLGLVLAEIHKGHLILQIDRDMRKARVEALHRRRDEGHRQTRCDADRHRAGDIGPVPPQVRRQGVELEVEVGQLQREGPPGLGQRDAGVAGDHELRAELLFQPLHLAADGRPARMEHCRRFREGAALGHRQKGSELLPDRTRQETGHIERRAIDHGTGMVERKSVRLGQDVIRLPNGAGCARKP